MVDNNVYEAETDHLLEEFQALIKSISKELIDGTVMDDLNLLKEALTREMGNFTQFVNKINTLTSNMDNILSQTTQNMSSLIKTKTTDMDNVLSHATHTMNTTFTAITADMSDLVKDTTDTIDKNVNGITSDIKSVLNETTDIMNNKLNDTTTDINRLLKDATEKLDTMISESNRNVDRLMHTSTATFEDTTSLMTEKMAVLADKNADNMTHLVNETKGFMNDALKETVDKVDSVIHATSTSFSDEIKAVKNFLIESETLIKSNQTIISNVQRNIDTKLQDALRQIELTSAATRDDLSNVIATIETQVKSMSRENKGLVELHNIINIKTDNGLSKMKTTISKLDKCITLLEEDSKAKKRYKTTLIFNTVTLLSVMISFIILFLRG